MPSESFVKERAAVAEKLREVVQRYLDDADIPEVNDRGEAVFGENAIGTHPSTREMRFFLHDLKPFTPELIARIRKGVLAEFPKWKIAPQFYRQRFTISAKSVDFGEKSARGEITTDTPAYQKWWRDAVAVDEASFGEDRKVFRFVTGLVPGVLPRVAKERFVCVAAFSSDGTSAGVWLLAAPEENAVFREKYGPLRKFAVTADGVVHPEFCKDFWPHTDRQPAAWLKLFIRKDGTETEPDLFSPEGKKVGTVRVPEYLTDDEFEKRLAAKQ
jgi:hypothetical protein